MRHEQGNATLRVCRRRIAGNCCCHVEAQPAAIRSTRLRSTFTRVVTIPHAKPSVYGPLPAQLRFQDGSEAAPPPFPPPLPGRCLCG